jgi:signal transduction histidine kinase
MLQLQSNIEVMRAVGTEDKIPGFSLILFIISLLVISGGVLFYRSQKKKLMDEERNELAAVVSLKVNDIERWRMEHIRDGNIINTIVPIDQLLFYFLEDSSQSGIKNELLKRMEIFIRNYDYHSILLIDTTGTVRLAFPPVDKQMPFRLPFDFDRNDISFSDLHYSPDMPGIHIDMHVPVILPDKNKTVEGAIVLRIDPAVTLYPLIQWWPVPSRTSETMLVRQEGDSVVYLNELRLEKHTALILKHSLKDLSHVASAAISGKVGFMEGLDYRNVPVISYLKKVPDSPWYLVAKTDRDEVLEPLNEQIILISVIVILIILSVGVMLVYFRRHQRMIFYKELNATKDKFFSIISHDLRSPFVSIRGFTDYLIEELKNKKYDNAVEHAAIIQNSSRNAVNLLNNLTEWAKLQSNRIEIKREEFDLVQVVDSESELLGTSAFNKGIRINRNTPGQLKVIADKKMISTVLRNLISNAIKFSRPGSDIFIDVAVSKNEAMVEVRDHGVGIDREIVGRLFRIEENISTHGTLNEEGTGLGLVLCKEFITKHEGRIWCESEPGKGSRFIFTIPSDRQRGSR